MCEKMVEMCMAGIKVGFKAAYILIQQEVGLI